jgi:hypothetical protein
LTSCFAADEVVEELGSDDGDGSSPARAAPTLLQTAQRYERAEMT